MGEMKLVLIGDGPSRAELETRAKGAGVSFAGTMTRSAVRSRMADAKALLLPSEWYEGMPMTLLEGFASATPAVVSDLGALPGLVRGGELGFVFRHGDADALAAAIRRILDLDDESFDRMAAAARREARSKYSEEANYARIQEIYGDAKRVLVVHNFYGSSAPSGENQVFESECAVLRRRGVEVRTFTRHSDEIRLGGAFRRAWGVLKGAASVVANPFSAFRLARVLRAFRPDVVHFHNTFPLLSPLAVRAAHRAGCRVVLTLHNYRTVCAAGIPMRGGQVCTDCFGGSVGPALRHRCYRGSLAATLPLALNITLYRRALTRWVDAFVALSEFQRGKMVACGFPPEKVVVKPNFVELGDEPIVPAAERKDEVLYVGRLSPEKGVFTLVEAWRKLAEIGRGGVDNDSYLVVFLGLRQKAEVRERVRHARCVALPSEWYETFGLAVVEAMSSGTPVVVSDLGALKEIVR